MNVSIRRLMPMTTVGVTEMIHEAGAGTLSGRLLCEIIT